MFRWFASLGGRRSAIEPLVELFGFTVRALDDAWSVENISGCKFSRIIKIQLAYSRFPIGTVRGTPRLWLGPVRRRTPCSNSGRRARTATRHSRPTHLKHAFARMNVLFVQRVSTMFWATYAPTAVEGLFRVRSDRPTIGRATTSSERIRLARRSGTSQLIEQLTYSSQKLLEA